MTTRRGQLLWRGWGLDRLDIPPNTRTNTCTLQLWKCQPQLHDKQPANQITGENNGAWMPSSISTGCWGHTDIIRHVLLKMWEFFWEVGLLYLLAAYVCSIKVRHGNEFQWLWRVIWQCRGTLRVRHVQQTSAYCALSGLTSQTVTANVVTKRHQCHSCKYTEQNRNCDILYRLVSHIWRTNLFKRWDWTL